MPLGVSAIRGVARPDLGFNIIDLVTTAPSSVKLKNWLSSLPEPAQPLAVNIGFSNSACPKLVR